MPANQHLTLKDRQVLRDLAKRVAEIAADPVMGERRRLWSAHNSLRSKGPMMLIFPEGAWMELIPENTLQCESEKARAAELSLRQTIYTYEHFQDDIGSAEDFIRLCATLSLVTGKPYMLVGKDGRELATGDWLARELLEYRRKSAMAGP